MQDALAELGGRLPAQVTLAIGTRPEAIKLAPVADALAALGREPLLVLTGQHPLDPADYGLERRRSVRLDCQGGGDPHAHARAVAAAIEPLLAETDLLIVQGDTSSALGGALAASAVHVPLAHVEAGLRSHDRRRPWPEEEFRLEIDARAQLLFAPTELSAANLQRERVSGIVHVTGNSGIDAVLAARQRLCPAPVRDRELPSLLVTCHRRESWGLGLAGIAGALRSLAERRVATFDLLLHPNPATAAYVRALLLGCDGVVLHPPQSHAQTVAAMITAGAVVSDSGGMQEECAALGLPLLVLRERTERPEAIASGGMALVGTDPDRIIRAVEELVARPPGQPIRPGLPYGDGRAAERTAGLIDEWLKAGHRGRSPGLASSPRRAPCW